MSNDSGRASRHVALLRGINVGGKNVLPMKTLVAMFERAGARNARTYIQSGNVVFDASEKVAARIASAIETAIAKEAGLSVPVVMRSAIELEATVKANPFLARGEAADAVLVMFLARVPDAKALATLDPQRSPGDEFVVVGRDVHLFLPNGVGRTKLTNAWFDSKLATVSTGRNWRTVLELLEMTRA
jgi:uncharacterized protein (DUF1697 family)